jgi:glycosyltransferase involved in cell wall biosynthesis
MRVSSEPEVSIIIPTYNRSSLLHAAVTSVLNQNSDTTFEILVVDNNSQDDTKVVVHTLIEKHPKQLRYIAEAKQGNSYARNCGIETAKGAIIAFVDDDVTVDSDWLKSLKNVLDSRSDLSFIGGKVLPCWHGPPPSWVTREHWAPLALLDYGDEELMISGSQPRGLLTANIAFRRNVFQEVGMFSPQLQRVKDTIGSMEDHEFLLRVCRTGRKGMYVPSMIARGDIESGRLTKTYHRRWHTGHGRFYAMLRDPEWEHSRFHLVDVPSHLYKHAAIHTLRWLSNVLTGNSDAAFTHECQLRFFRGFLSQRRR